MLYKKYIARLGWLLVFLMVTPCVLAWNSMGHQLVAQIAYDEMTPCAKQLYETFFHHGKARSFMNTANWLDKIRSRNDPYYNEMHYIDIPFTKDGSVLPDVAKHNAVSAIEIAVSILSNPKESSQHKKEAIKILLHVVGDIHQPLHAATEVSNAHKSGDRGGNLVLLAHPSIAKNLHAYWDKGAGLLMHKKAHQKAAIKQLANQLLQQYPCLVHHDVNPEVWANESHSLAINTAYLFSSGAKLDKSYQLRSQLVVKQRIAVAGCRLAKLMNHIAMINESSRKVAIQS